MKNAVCAYVMPGRGTETTSLAQSEQEIVHESLSDYSTYNSSSSLCLKQEAITKETSGAEENGVIERVPTLVHKDVTGYPMIPRLLTTFGPLGINSLRGAVCPVCRDVLRESTCVNYSTPAVDESIQRRKFYSSEGKITAIAGAGGLEGSIGARGELDQLNAADVSGDECMGSWKDNMKTGIFSIAHNSSSSSFTSSSICTPVLLEDEPDMRPVSKVMASFTRNFDIDYVNVETPVSSFIRKSVNKIEMADMWIDNGANRESTIVTLCSEDEEEFPVDFLAGQMEEGNPTRQEANLRPHYTDSNIPVLAYSGAV